MCFKTNWSQLVNSLTNIRMQYNQLLNNVSLLRYLNTKIIKRIFKINFFDIFAIKIENQRISMDHI